MPATTPIYLLLSGLAAGVAATLVLTPTSVTSRGFTRTMSWVASGCLAVAVLYDLWFRVGETGRAGLDSAAGGLAVGAQVGALAMLLLLIRRSASETPGRALPLAATLLAGLAPVMAPPLMMLAAPGEVRALAALQGAAGAVVLGTGMSAMLLGHFYLIVPGLSIEPLRLLTRCFLAALVVRIALDGVTLAVTGTEAVWPDLTASGADPLGGTLLGIVPLLMRVLFGLAGALMLAVMTERTVAIRSTQSATGILYAAVVFVLIGEFAAGHLLVASGVPL